MKKPDLTPEEMMNNVSYDTQKGINKMTKIIIISFLSIFILICLMVAGYQFTRKNNNIRTAERKITETKTSVAKDSKEYPFYLPEWARSANQPKGSENDSNIIETFAPFDFATLFNSLPSKDEGLETNDYITQEDATLYVGNLIARLIYPSYGEYKDAIEYNDNIKSTYGVVPQNSDIYKTDKYIGDIQSINSEIAENGDFTINIKIKYYNVDKLSDAPVDGVITILGTVGKNISISEIK